MATTITRTLNPLPFGDLEPKRFEDLVRQLAYEFRPWRKLEATGRSGSDDGFDARGYEIATLESDAAPGDEEEEDAHAFAGDRLWLVQCKRERRISPSGLGVHLGGIHIDPAEPLYGIIFAAACDFSLATRRKLAEWATANGVSEVYLWGKGELEDALFQPKNDHLLFAYFGISLSIRRRGIATQLRADIALKRKLKRVVIDPGATVLVRDPDSPKYPDERGKGPSMKWKVFSSRGLSHKGLVLVVNRHFAFMDPATGAWDAADGDSQDWVHPNPWEEEKTEEQRELSNEARGVWDGIPKGKQGWLIVTGVLALANIIAVDDIGDEIFQGPHIIASWKGGKLGPFEGFYVQLENNDQWAQSVSPDPETRIVQFPRGARLVGPNAT